MSVEINRKEQLITILTNEGNKKVIGFTAQVNQFPVSLYPYTKDPEHVYLVVSDIKTGVKLQDLHISLSEFWMADTKSQTLELFYEKLKLFSACMTTEMIEQIKSKRSAYPKVPNPKSADLNIADFMRGAYE